MFDSWERRDWQLQLTIEFGKKNEIKLLTNWSGIPSTKVQPDVYHCTASKYTDIQSFFHVTRLLGCTNSPKDI